MAKKSIIIKKGDPKRAKEVKRVLNSNKDLEESHIPFASRFLFSLIKEQEEAAKAPADLDQTKSPEDFTPEGDKQAFDQSMEPETPEGKFDTEGVSPEVTSETIKKIGEWSKELDNFASFLNDPTTESLHKILANGDRAGSLLRGVTRKASDSITRIAGEVEKLKEILNTYIITAPKKMRDTEQQTPGWTQY